MDIALALRLPSKRGGGERIPNPEPSRVKYNIAESFSKTPPSPTCHKEMWHEEQLHNRLKQEMILWGWTLAYLQGSQGSYLRSFRVKLALFPGTSESTAPAEILPCTAPWPPSPPNEPKQHRHPHPLTSNSILSLQIPWSHIYIYILV